jgi:hypothetical protein
MLLIETLYLLINVKSHQLTPFAMDFRIITSVLPAVTGSVPIAGEELQSKIEQHTV